MRWTSLVALSACGGGPGAAGWMTELQVVAIAVDPPEVQPGSSARVTVTAADPRERGAEVVLWSCTDLGEGCVERLRPDGSPRPLREWARTGRLVEDRFEAVFDVPALPEALFGDPAEEDRVAVVWVLACAPAACGWVERIEADPAPGTEAWEVAARMLAQPDEWVGGWAPGWFSLAVKLVPLGTDGGNQNPIVAGTPERVALPADAGTFTLTLEDDANPRALAVEALTTWGFAEVGDVVEGEVRVAWTPPPGGAGQGKVYAVVRDGEGGIAVWTGEVSAVP